MRIGLAALALLVLAGCVDRMVESRVESALVEAGLSDQDAGCMARLMVEELTIAQLRKLKALKGDMQSMDDYVEAVRRVGDAETLAVTASAAVLCTTGLAR